MSAYKEPFLALLSNNNSIIQNLSSVRELGLTDWYVAAGYVRNYIWDCLHNYATRTPLNDIDVIYYDSTESDEAIEKEYELRLKQSTGISIWSVKNQARMHTRNGDAPYTSIEDAISHWPETVTAVGIRLEADDSLTYISPYGLDDIFEYRVRQSPLFMDEKYYRTRVSKKNWKGIWPRLEIN